MNQLHSTTTSHKKGKLLSFDGRVVIQLRIKDNYSIRAIAREIGCSPTTVSNEIKRGTVLMYKNHSLHYRAKSGQSKYETNRLNSCRNYDFLEKSQFMNYVANHFFSDGWSLDACFGRALNSGMFKQEEMVCVKTLYNYVDSGLIEIKSYHLPEKLSRKPKKKVYNVNKRKLGRSIEERPECVNSRNEFGHWECDLVLGAKTKDDNVLLTLLERMTREYWIIPLANKNSETVLNAFMELKTHYEEHFNEVFKTITTDNGSEFADLSNLEAVSKTLIYYAHPYTSCEKGAFERYNGLIRRFLPKGKRIDQYNIQEIFDVETWANSLPREILGTKLLMNYSRMN
jgi:transposase